MWCIYMDMTHDTEERDRNVSWFFADGTGGNYAAEYDVGCHCNAGDDEVWGWLYERKDSGGNSTAAVVRNIARWLRWNLTPTLVVLGFLTNSVAVVVLLTTSLRYRSSTQYLVGSSIISSVYLLALAIEWMRVFGIDLYNAAGWCQFVFFVNSLCTFLTVWYVVCFAVDRYIYTCWPKKAHRVCSTLKAKATILALLLVGTVVYVNISLTFGVVTMKGRPRCSPVPRFLSHLRILGIPDMIVNILLPYSVVVYLLVAMCRKWRSSKNHLMLIVNCRQCSGEIRCTRHPFDKESGRRNSEYTSKDPQLRKFTLVFLLLFLVLRVPAEVFRILHTARGLFSEDSFTPKVACYTQVMAKHMLNTSLVVHFFVCVTCHGDFAKELKGVMCKFWKNANSKMSAVLSNRNTVDNEV